MSSVGAGDFIPRWEKVEAHRKQQLEQAAPVRPRSDAAELREEAPKEPQRQQGGFADKNLED